jgi:hypothetical protein
MWSLGLVHVKVILSILPWRENMGNLYDLGRIQSYSGNKCSVMLTTQRAIIIQNSSITYTADILKASICLK